MDTAWTRLGTLGLEGLGGLPYFKGKGVLALGVLRLCRRAQPLTLELPLQVHDPPAAATQNVLALPPSREP
jgi:hypothetical protein